MDIQSRKIEFLSEFLKVQNEDVILRLEKILYNEKKKPLNDQFEPMTIQEFNSRIDKSMEDSKNGRITNASDLKSKIEKWT